MNTAKQNRSALQSLSALNIRAYLNSHGWTDEGPWGRRERGALYIKEDGARAWDIVLPYMDTVSDYSRRVAEAITTLAQAEERSELDVYHDIANTGADVIRLLSRNGRAEEPISLRQAAELLSGSYAMLSAAARSTERPQSVHRGSISAEVSRYLDSVRPLPNHFDGYTLALHSPAPVLVGMQRDLGDDYRPPFSRRATLRLKEALESISEAIGEAIAQDTLEPFEKAVTSGVSANLCTAVADLAENGSGIDIILNWAEERPANVENQRFPFSANSAQILKDVAISFRKNEPSTGELITGHVARLDREPPDKFDGNAVILSTRDESQVRIRVEFKETDFAKVIQAFRDLAPISLVGDVHRDGRAYELRNPRNLSLLSNDQ